MISGINGSNYWYQSSMQGMSTHNKTSPAAAFENADTDSSNTLSQTELESFASQFQTDTGQSLDVSSAMNNYDTDGDGALSQDEMDQFMQSTMQNMGTFGMQAMGGMPGGPMGMGGGNQPPDLFSALDSDGSGGVSESELSAWATDMEAETGSSIDTSSTLSEYDLDGDGELSSEELASFLKAGGIGAPSMASEEDEDSTSAGSVISKYDTDGDGVLSSSELQAYLDEVSSASKTNYAQMAFNSYLNNMSSFINAGGGNNYRDLGGYSPIDYSA